MYEHRSFKETPTTPEFRAKAAEWVISVVIFGAVAVFLIKQLHLSDAAIDRIIQATVLGLVVTLGYAAFIGLRKVWRKTKHVGSNIVPPLRDAAVLGAAVTALAARDFLTRNKVCPFCRETVKRDAVICKHCHQKI